MLRSLTCDNKLRSNVPKSRPISRTSYLLMIYKAMVVSACKLPIKCCDFVGSNITSYNIFFHFEANMQSQSSTHSFLLLFICSLVIFCITVLIIRLFGKQTTQRHVSGCTYGTTLSTLPPYTYRPGGPLQACLKFLSPVSYVTALYSSFTRFCWTGSGFLINHCSKVAEVLFTNKYFLCWIWMYLEKYYCCFQWKSTGWYTHNIRSETQWSQVMVTSICMSRDSYLLLSDHNYSGKCQSHFRRPCSNDVRRRQKRSRLLRTLLRQCCRTTNFDQIFICRQSAPCLSVRSRLLGGNPQYAMTVFPQLSNNRLLTSCPSSTDLLPLTLDEDLYPMYVLQASKL